MEMSDMNARSRSPSVLPLYCRPSRRWTPAGTLGIVASNAPANTLSLSLTGLASSEYPNTNMSFLNTAWGLCFYSLAYRLGVSVSILLLIAVLFLGYLLV
jgi:hypothetical protein